MQVRLKAPTEVLDDRPLPPSLDANEVASRLTRWFSIGDARGTFWLWLFQRTLAWVLGRASDATKRASLKSSWLRLEADKRFYAPSLREVAWTAVLEDDRGLDEFSRAAAVIVAALEFRSELLSPSASARMREQCGAIFHATLLPRADRFELYRGSGRHVFVGVYGSHFAVEVLEEDGSIRDAAEIADDLRACAAVEASEKSPVLALTARPRVEAASSWPRIAEDSAGAAECLREAVFSVFFDPSSPPDADACGRFAQGASTDNRCFWHALQLVVFRNGKAAGVGSFVAGVEGEGALELFTRLGAARGGVSKKRIRKKTDASFEPRPLRWTVDPRESARLSTFAERPPENAGGLVRVPRFGTAEWTSAGVSPELATVLALRLALDQVAPNLDDLDCMVNLAHFQDGTVRRVSTTTPALSALLESATTEGADLGALFRAALDAQRDRVRDAKRLKTGKLGLEFSIFALSHASGWARWLLRFVVGGLGVALTSSTPREQRGQLLRPKVAVDSSVPSRPGLAAAGRFGVLAPTESVWVHHSFSENECRFVFQLSREHVANAKQFREAIPAALTRLMAAAREHAKPALVAGELDVAATVRIAARDLAYLSNELRKRHFVSEARRSLPARAEGQSPRLAP